MDSKKYSTLKERFLRYVKFNTRSNEASETIPSTPSQMEFAKMLKKELEELGLSNIFINKACFVNATLPSNIDKKVATVGFIAHMDTADFNAEGIKEHREIKHGDIKIAFGPDEEIGRGADYFDVKEFAADYAYTMDGGPVGELEYESFNAAQAKFKIKGVSVHPGTAKGKMINASLIASEIIEMFPKDEVPEKTEGYEGFYFLDEMKSNCEEGEVVYIIRDHDKAKFLAKKEFVKELVEKVNKKYGKEVVKLELKDEYYNMGEIIKDHMYVVDIAKQAMENLGIKPLIKAIRGGTDGSKISFMGLPTPNIFAGGENFHGKYEFVALESMEKATDVIVEIIKLNAER